MTQQSAAAAQHNTCHICWHLFGLHLLITNAAALQQQVQHDQVSSKGRTHSNSQRGASLLPATKWPDAGKPVHFAAQCSMTHANQDACHFTSLHTCSNTPTTPCKCRLCQDTNLHPPSLSTCTHLQLAVPLCNCRKLPDDVHRLPNHQPQPADRQDIP